MTTKPTPDADPDDHFEPFDDEPEDDDAVDLDECGMMPDGQCTLAGSEWCDWECPLDRLPRQASPELRQVLADALAKQSQ
jgi:hypothetical protein